MSGGPANATSGWSRRWWNWRRWKQAKAQQHDKPTKDHPARASSTDPEARMMRMPDGGTRPAFNLELATDCGSRAIVGVEATNAGSDAGQDAADAGSGGGAGRRGD